MTEPADAFQELVSACDGLKQRLAEDESFQSLSAGLPYVEVGWVGAAVAEMVKNGDESCVRLVLDLAERLLAEHRKDLWELIAIGFLESLQNLIGHRELDEAVFMKHLGPEGRIAWDYLNDIWAGKQVQPPYG